MSVTFCLRVCLALIREKFDYNDNSPMAQYGLGYGSIIADTPVQMAPGLILLTLNGHQTMQAPSKLDH